MLLLMPCPLLLMLLLYPNLSSCSGPSCWPVPRVVEACGLECGENVHGLASNCEARTEHLVFCDALNRTGLGYQTRRGKLDSKSLSSGEVQETYARSTMLKIPCCRPQKQAFAMPKPQVVLNEEQTAVNCLSSLGPLHNFHLQCLTTLTLWLSLLI